MFRVTDKPIIQTADDVKAVVLLFSALPRFDDPLEYISARLIAINKAVIAGDTPSITSSDFGLIGCSVIQLLSKYEEFSRETWDSFARLLLDKHQRYGAHPLRVWGALGIIIRIHSKFERFQNLKENPEMLLLDEGLLDTLRDILGYTILGYIMVKP
jgi:hypothetical protein